MMKKLNKERYKYFTTKTSDGRMKTIAISKYAGRTVRGVAICDINDKYDEELGKKIAAARCAIKITQKKYQRACEKAEKAKEDKKRNELLEEKMRQYMQDSLARFNEYQEELRDLL